MSSEHFVTPKDQTIFMINNLEFFVSQFQNFSLKKSKSEIQTIQKNLEQQMQRLIKIYLTINFEDLCNLCAQFIVEDEETEDTQEDRITPQKV